MAPCSSPAGAGEDYFRQHKDANRASSGSRPPRPYDLRRTGRVVCADLAEADRHGTIPYLAIDQSYAH
jgi:hypothetical protein